MKTTQYFIVTASILTDLIEKVNKQISEGWQPIGGVCVMEEGFPGFYQAMVIYEHETLRFG